MVNTKNTQETPVVSAVSSSLDAILRRCLLQLIHSPESVSVLQQLSNELQAVLGAEQCLLLDAGANNHTLEQAEWLKVLLHSAENIPYFALDNKQTRLIFPLRFERRLCGGLLLSWPDQAAYTVPGLEAVSQLAPVLAQMLFNITQARDQRRHDLYEERAAISRELHDSLAQSLTYLKIQATRLHVALRQYEPENKAADQLSEQKLPSPIAYTAQDILAELRTNLNDAYRQLRNLMTTFRLTIHGKSFKLAVRDSVDEFSKYNNMVFELNDRCPADILTVEEEMQVLQIIREALYNSVKHSQATTALVALHFEEPVLLVSVRDNGIGFDDQQKHERHHGMTIMQERAYRLGGKLRTQNINTGGTALEVTFVPKRYVGHV